MGIEEKTGVDNPEGNELVVGRIEFPKVEGEVVCRMPDDSVARPTLEQMGEGADGGGQRMNAGKLRMDLTPPEWEWALADVTTQGSKKYAERNWEKGMKHSAMIGCIKRHINKYLAGERYDGPGFNKKFGTTGCHHLAMAAWNCLALMSYDIRRIGENDLPKEVQLELFERVNADTSDLGSGIHEKG